MIFIKYHFSVIIWCIYINNHKYYESLNEESKVMIIIMRSILINMEWNLWYFAIYLWHFKMS